MDSCLPSHSSNECVVEPALEHNTCPETFSFIHEKSQERKPSSCAEKPLGLGRPENLKILVKLNVLPETTTTTDGINVGPITPHISARYSHYCEEHTLPAWPAIRSVLCQTTCIICFMQHLSMISASLTHFRCGAILVRMGCLGASSRIHYHRKRHYHRTNSV